jgi:IclR family pca regulon transcriptional regulator
VLLAALPKAAFNDWMKKRVLARLTLHTVTEAKAFRAVIEQVRRDDFSLSSEEHELGVHALAVPLRNVQGQTVAALNVVASPSRLAPEVMRRDLLPLLQDAMRELRPLL